MGRYGFEGDMDDLRVCDEANYEQAFRMPNSTIEKMKIRGTVVDQPFRFVTAAPTP